MKKIILLVWFSTFLSLFAQAQAVIPPPIIVIKIAEVSAEIQSIELNDLGTITVFPQNKLNPILTFELSSSNRNDLLNKAQIFSNPNFPIITDIREITCDILEDPYSKKVYAYELASNSFKLILSPSGCQYDKYTHPVYDYNLRQVEELRVQLITLALQYANI